MDWLDPIIGWPIAIALILICVRRAIRGEL